MKTITLAAVFAQDLRNGVAPPQCGFKVVADYEIDTARWAVIRTLVIRDPDGKLFAGTYRLGTGDSGEQPWEHDEGAEFTEVIARQKVTTEYVSADKASATELDGRDEAADELATELAEARTELQKQDAELRRLHALFDEAHQSLPIEQRRLLSISRMVFDRHAEGDTLSRDDAADLAQRIVDEIGHSVTEEPALGPSFRVEIAELKATVDRVRALHVESGCGFCAADPEGCGLCEGKPWCGHCSKDWPCPTIAALDQPADSKEA